jgi:alpha-tubulin suppressor-like RCC1 family protein
MFHTCAIASSYRAFCWGKGDYGQLGTGRTLPKSLWPRGVAGGLTLDRVIAGDTHTCGEATNNRAYCWGRNFYGELGDGTTTQRLSPVAVTGGLFFSQLTAGDQHTCGRTSAAVAYCWGHNWRGQLGDGTTDARLTPTPVAGVM